MRIVALVCALLSAGPLSAQQRVSHGRFKDVALYRPQGEAKQFVLFLSGDGGWSLGVLDMAKALVARGAMVAGVNVPQFLASLNASSESCVYPDGDLENLSHYLQGYAKLRTYHTPLVFGYSSGATLAYAALAQAPRGTFGGAMSLGFCPDLAMKVPLCKGDDLRYEKRSDGHGINVLPTSTQQTPWIVLQGQIDQVCDAKATRDFVGRVPEGSLVELPKVGHGFGVPAHWMPQYLQGYATLAAKVPAPVPPPKTLAGLPVVEVPAKSGAPPAERFALIVSGDGGWAGLDRDVADELTRKGIPVVGLDSLRYFWSARTPEGFAADVDRILRYYADRWHKASALVIGYSQGADVLPFAYNRLPPQAREIVARLVLLAPGRNASFEFHLGNWLGADQGGLPILPEARKLSGPVLCVYSKDDADALCPKVGTPNVRVAALPGGHHFGGAYSKLAELILAPTS